MAVLADLRLGIIPFWFMACGTGTVFFIEVGGIVMAIGAGYAVTVICGVYLVIEKNVSCNAFENDPDGSIR